MKKSLEAYLLECGFKKINQTRFEFYSKFLPPSEAKIEVFFNPYDSRFLSLFMKTPYKQMHTVVDWGNEKEEQTVQKAIQQFYRIIRESIRDKKEIEEGTKNFWKMIKKYQFKQIPDTELFEVQFPNGRHVVVLPNLNHHIVDVSFSKNKYSNEYHTIAFSEMKRILEIPEKIQGFLHDETYLDGWISPDSFDEIYQKRKEKYENYPNLLHTFEIIVTNLDPKDWMYFFEMEFEKEQLWLSVNWKRTYLSRYQTKFNEMIQHADLNKTYIEIHIQDNYTDIKFANVTIDEEEIKKIIDVIKKAKEPR